jgi:acetyl esterase/lipase
MSWQNLALSWFLRKRMKRLAKTTFQGDIDGTDSPLDVASIRRRVDRMWLTSRPAAGWKIRSVMGSATMNKHASLSLVDPSAHHQPDACAEAVTGTTVKTRVPGEWIEVATPSLSKMISRTILYLHGGGYFFCSPRTHRGITCALARAAMANVFVPEYRLAPEYPAPSALEDALSAYRQLLDEGREAHSIVVAGDSAGGGLALALLMALRDAGEPQPAAAVLFSPWTDLAVTGDTVASLADRDVLFDGRGLRAAADLYLSGALTDATAPQVSPLYGNFVGLAPLMIQASDSEVLLDDARRVADKARDAGIAVDFQVWQGLPHAWQIFSPFLPEARKSLRQAAVFIRQHARTLA